MALKLYTYPNNARAFKALIAAEFSGATIELPTFQFGVTNKTPEFQALTPLGKVPVLSTPEGGIFESNAIARYVARLGDTSLFGSSPIDQAHVDQWIDFSSNELETPLQQWGMPLFGMGQRIKEVEEKAKTNAIRGLATLNSYLATRTYLVGDHITLADIIAACSLYLPFKALLSPAFLEPYPHVSRYFFTLANQPAFKKHFGDIKQVDETPTDVVPPEKNPFRQITPAAAAPKKEEPKEAPKEAAKPAPAAAAAAEEEPKPKAKNPLDLLPPSPMILDAWKRLYSNTKTNFHEVAIKGFWEMYDPEGYSLWFADYKHNDENTVKFVTMNKVGGFLQRMDLVRKYAFAKMLILGADPGPYQIKGVWLFRGPEVPQIVREEVYDYELFEWTKVDLSDQAQKDRVSIYIEEADVVDGLELQEAKCFK